MDFNFDSFFDSVLDYGVKAGDVYTSFQSQKKDKIEMGEKNSRVDIAPVSPVGVPVNIKNIPPGYDAKLFQNVTVKTIGISAAILLLIVIITKKVL